MLLKLYLGLILDVIRIGSWLVLVLLRVGSDFLEGSVVFSVSLRLDARSCFWRTGDGWGATKCTS